MARIAATVSSPSIFPAAAALGVPVLTPGGAGLPLDARLAPRPSVGVGAGLIATVGGGEPGVPFNRLQKCP